MTTLAILDPIDPGTGERVTVRVCSANTVEATGAAGERWWPAMSEEPTLSLALFDGDFTSAVEPGTAQITLRLDALKRARRAVSLFPRVERYDWAGASVRLYRLVGGLPLDLAVMSVERFAIENEALALRLKVDSEWAQGDVLFRSYAGTTGAEGGADLKGQHKPWVFGRALNVEPVFIDQIDNVFQVSGYGPVEAISAVYERGADFGPSIGDFASYDDLVAATIAPGFWGTCLAQGMFRLGAPPSGVITCDVDGDNTRGFLRRTGAILKEIARRLGLSASVNADSLDALDAAVPRNVNIVISDQTSFLELARRMAAPCNAVAGLALDGRLITPRVAFGPEVMTLDAQGRQMPAVLGMARQNTRPPYKRIQMGAARCWRVHSFDEIAFYAELIDRGLYDEEATYREGHIVELIDKSRWVYVNPQPSSGNAPPIWPTASNAFWSNIAPPIGGDLIGSIVAPANANRVPFSRMEGDQGWAVNYNPSSLAATTTYETSDGRRFFRATATATASGQDFSIGNASTSAPAFVLAPGSRVSAQARLETTGSAGGAWRLALIGHTATGTQSELASVSGSGLRSLTAAPAQMFVDVPADIVGGRLEFYARTTGAGAFSLAIAEPMVTSAAPGQTVHPNFTPGPNAVDGAQPNNFITIDGSGILTGIGTANVPVANTQVALSGTAAARPASGGFTGQLYAATDRDEVYRWNGSAWVTTADVTTGAQRSIVPQFPIIEVRQGDPGHTGNRDITHDAKRGTAALNGGTWSLPAKNLGAGTATIASSTGVVTLSGIVQSGSYTVRYTHTDGVATDLVVNVTYVPAAASGGSSSSGSAAISSFSSSSYSAVTSEIAITLPSGVTTATLTAANVQLDLGPEAPMGSTTVQMIWQRESSPGTWVDVGSAATSSPNPLVSLDGEGYYEATPGAITCNATVTGLTAGSAQKFRLLARVSAGNVRPVFPAGAALVSS